MEKELRIGNYVWLELKLPSLDTHQLTAKDFEHLEALIITKSIQPIPLDEDWLLDFEFEKALNGWWDKHEILQIRHEDGIFLAYWHGAILCKLEYVHRLQNLYYELSDEELIRKQNVNK